MKLVTLKTPTGVIHQFGHLRGFAHDKATKRHLRELNKGMHTLIEKTPTIRVYSVSFVDGTEYVATFTHY